MRPTNPEKLRQAGDGFSSTKRGGDYLPLTRNDGATNDAVAQAIYYSAASIVEAIDRLAHAVSVR